MLLVQLTERTSTTIMPQFFKRKCFGFTLKEVESLNKNIEKTGANILEDP
jgi:hypothetical protein